MFYHDTNYHKILLIFGCCYDRLFAYFQMKHKMIILFMPFHYRPEDWNKPGVENVDNEYNLRALFFFSANSVWRKVSTYMQKFCTHLHTGLIDRCQYRIRPTLTFESKELKPSIITRNHLPHPSQLTDSNTHPGEDLAGRQLSHIFSKAM